MTDHERRVAVLSTVAHAGITLDTLAALLKHNHGLGAGCAERLWANLGFARLNVRCHGQQRWRDVMYLGMRALDAWLADHTDVWLLRPEGTHACGELGQQLPFSPQQAPLDRHAEA